MVDVASQLLQLRDIHLPAPMGHWPLAIGWIVLFALILSMFFIGLWVWRHRVYHRARTQGLAALHLYQKAYAEDPLSENYAACVSELLKRVALVYFQRTSVASLQGDEWIDFLEKTSCQIDFKSIAPLLRDAPFQPNTKEDLTPLFLAAKMWVKQRRKRCMN